MPDEFKKLEDKMNTQKKKLEMHRQEAKETHEYSQKFVKQCSNDWCLTGVNHLFLVARIITKSLTMMCLVL